MKHTEWIRNMAPTDASDLISPLRVNFSLGIFWAEQNADRRNKYRDLIFVPVHTPPERIFFLMLTAVTKTLAGLARCCLYSSEPWAFSGGLVCSFAFYTCRPEPGDVTSA